MIKRIIDKFWRIYLGYKNPKRLAEILFKRILERDPNFENPKSLNEKINWLKFNSDTAKWTQLADKYLVRDYIRSKGLGEYLIPFYGMWENIDDINFEELPKSFVLKSNNGCKTVLIVRDKNELDVKKVKKLLKKWMKIKFGYETAEPHYLNIKPCIVAEKFLEEENSISSTLIDYKFICIHGEPTYVKVMSNRDKAKYNLSLYDYKWNLCEHFMNPKLKELSLSIPKPKSLNEMLHICKVLSKDFPEVRIDLYEVDGRPYFGEMTFTTFGGYDSDFTLELDLIMGEKLCLELNEPGQL